MLPVCHQDGVTCELKHWSEVLCVIWCMIWPCVQANIASSAAVSATDRSLNSSATAAWFSHEGDAADPRSARLLLCLEWRQWPSLTLQRHVRCVTASCLLFSFPSLSFSIRLMVSVNQLWKVWKQTSIVWLLVQSDPDCFLLLRHFKATGHAKCFAAPDDENLTSWEMKCKPVLTVPRRVFHPLKCH